MLIFFLVSISNAALTSTKNIWPDSGRWVNLSEEGRNFNIEIQDNQLTLVTQLYSQNGKATWYFSQGLMTSANSYSGTLYEFTGGQCIDCAYTIPTNIGPVSSVSIEFASPMTAKLSWKGGTINLVHRDSAIGVDSNDGLLGEWAIITGDSGNFPVYFADRITLGSLWTDSKGDVHPTGNRSGYAGNSHLALADITSSGTHQLLLDSSTSYYQFYSFSFYSQNVLRGRNWIFEKTKEPSGSGVPFVAFRMKSRTAAKNLSGPAITEKPEYDTKLLSQSQDADVSIIQDPTRDTEIANQDDLYWEGIYKLHAKKSANHEDIKNQDSELVSTSDIRQQAGELSRLLKSAIDHR